MASAFSEMLWSGLKTYKEAIPRCHLIPKATLTQVDEKKIGYFENRYAPFALNLGRRTAVHVRQACPERSRRACPELVEGLTTNGNWHSLS